MNFLDFIKENIELIHLATTITLAVLTGIYVVFTKRLAKASKDLTEATIKNLEKPVLVYSKDKEGWNLHNVSNAVALNVISGTMNRTDLKEDSSLFISMIPPKGRLKVTWMKDTTNLFVQYTDLNGKLYQSICKDYESSFLEDVAPVNVRKPERYPHDLEKKLEFWVV